MKPVKAGEHTIVNIKRFENDQFYANRGVIFINDQFFGFSMEQKNNNNAINNSRINTGIYEAIKVYSKKRGSFWLLSDVPGRTDIILFHPGSYMRNFKGCIGCGDKLFKDRRTGERMILNTRKMCQKFMEITADIKKLTVCIK